MLWQRQQQFNELLGKLERISPDKPLFLSVEGEEGMGKHEFVEALFRQIPDAYFPLLHLNFAFHTGEAGQLPAQIIRQLNRDNHPQWEHFLQQFPRSARKFIRNTLQNHQIDELHNGSWHSDLFLQFVDFVAETHTPFLILENIHHLEYSRFQGYRLLLEQLKPFHPLVVFTRNPREKHHPEVPAEEVIELRKLSVQEVERSIAEYFPTQPMNARLITNHCYMKTGGNPGKIRFLLEGVYRPLIEEAGDGFIQVEKLREIRIGQQWEDLFQAVFDTLEVADRRLLGFLAHLNQPVHKADLFELMNYLFGNTEKHHHWQKAGFIQEVVQDGQRWQILASLRWQHWLKEMVLLEDLHDLLEFVHQQETTGKFQEIYRISALYYELGNMERAIELARLEGNHFAKQQKLTEAADRFYFLVRIASLYSGKVPQVEAILSHLSDLYWQIGAYDNSFEILRQLRERFASQSKPSPKEQKRWVEVNLKMIRTLIAMDAFQEARYLIREVRVKDFVDLATHAECDWLLGQVEENLSRRNFAIRNYRSAWEKFQQTGQTRRVVQVYRKLKELLKREAEPYRELVQQTLRYLRNRNPEGEENLPVMLDLMQIQMAQNEVVPAVSTGMQLLRLLRRYFYPQQRFQVSLYLSDLYARLGKWRYAAAHLENLLHRMRLTYRPARHMQVLIHLGMIYKEQGAYGKARKTLEQALELAFQHRFFNEQNEIKLHLGHLYLLVHALLYAVEYLSEARRWAEKTQNAPLQIMANLYLSFYEVQNRRFDRAHRLLVSAKKLVNTSGELMDYLNYLFYYALYLLERKQPQKALVLVELMLKRAPEWGRYRAAAYYLQGRAFALLEQVERSEKAFRHSREIARQCGYPQIIYLVECEWVRLLHRQKERNRFNQFLPQVCETIQTIANKIDDEILRHQFLEARYHEDIRYWCDLAG